MRVRIVFLALSCFSFGLVQACGDDTTTPPDGSTDGTVTDAPGADVVAQDTGTQDTGTGDSATGDSGGNDGGTTDSGGGSLSYVCDVDGGTVTSCAQCTGFTQPCAYCDTADASNVVGHCVAQGGNCAAAAPNNFGACGCGTDAGNCPESYEVCRSQSCRTCGENQTNGLACKGGGSCTSNTGTCQ